MTDNKINLEDSQQSFKSIKQLEDSQMMYVQSLESPYLNSMHDSNIVRPNQHSVVQSKANYNNEPIEHMKNLANFQVKTSSPEQSPTKLSQAISKENKSLYKGPGYTVEVRQNPPTSEKNLTNSQHNDQAQKIKRATTMKD